MKDLLKDKFLYGHASDTQQNFLQEMLNLGLEFYSGSLRNHKPLQYKTNQELKNLFSEPLPKEGCQYEDLIEVLRAKVVPYSIAQSDPSYLSFPDTGNSVAGLGGDIIAHFLNQNLIAIDRSAPSATFIELQLILWLRELVGYPTSSLDKEDLTLSDIGGMWTSGGNMSNHIAMLVALHSKFPELKEKGIFGLKKRPTIILAKDIEHFSFASAVNSLGLGKEGIEWAEANSDYTSNIETICAAIERSRNKGCEPFMLVCVAGNCRTTNIDNIKAFRQVSDKYGIWLHVDACHGGNLLFSKKQRCFLEGIETGDSISLDPHKGLFVTYPSSYVLFKNPQTLGNFSRYPDKAKSPECLDLGLIMPFYGSRGFHSLKLWLLIKHFGVNGLIEVLEHRATVNENLTELLDKTRLFILVNNNQFYRQAFLFCPEKVHAIIKEILYREAGIEIEKLRNLVSQYTKDYCQALYSRGVVIFDLFSLQDLNNLLGLGSKEKYNMMAMAIGHPYIEDERVRKIENEIITIGKIFEEKMLSDVRALTNEESQFLEHHNLAFNMSPASW